MAYITEHYNDISNEYGLNSIIITLGQKIIFMLIKQSINLQKFVPGTNYHLLLTGQIKTF